MSAATTADALAERLRSALDRDRGHEAQMGTWGGAVPRVILPDPPIPAAVLIAITDRAEPGVVLTQRPDTMRQHPGQVAFPGGRLDTDEDAIAAALREAHEEIALDPTLVDIVGTIDSHATTTGYAVTPVIGVIPPDLPLVPSEAEVAAVFEVPLAWLCDPANYGEGTVMIAGRSRRFIEMRWADRRIWGATAAIIADLSLRLT